MKKILQILFIIYCFLPILSHGEPSSHDIHIEWSFDDQSVEGKTLVGYNLYKEGIKVCSDDSPADKKMDCVIVSEPGTYNFTLTALYSDYSESPHSPPYSFQLGTEQPPGGEEGDHSFSFKWEVEGDTSDIAAYRIYLNNKVLCQTGDAETYEISCKTDLLSEVMYFTITSLYIDNTESNPSNLLKFDPSEYPQLLNTRLLSFSWDYPDNPDLAGFRVYYNGRQICETTNPADRQLSCIAAIDSDTLVFSVSAVFLDQSETALSNNLTYTAGDNSQGSGELQAVITTSTVGGPAPLMVSFGAAGSIGDIISYAWSFGDGVTADTSSVDHQYTSPGIYNASLTVTDSSGAMSSETVSIQVAEGTPGNTPPHAVISSSTALGPAPLTVSFDGQGSTASNTLITLYHWDFGDGSDATGKSVTHLYSQPGSFNAVLTVTDGNGLTDSISTPVIVSSSQQENQPPQAVFTVSSSSGSAPLTVTFNGGGSKDSDGSISSYSWQFGDGATAGGISTTHTYTSEATFTATLMVTDNDGAKSSYSKIISVVSEEDLPPFNIEMGEVAVNSDWATVNLSSSFRNPVVVAGPPSSFDSEPCVVRLQNISTTGFEIRLEEWDYLDGRHPEENVSYMVMEKGHFILPDGTQVEAGTFAGKTDSASNGFKEPFNSSPVVFTSIVSDNEEDTVAGRLRNITKNGFDYYFHEQEKNTNGHIIETVNYIAWEQGTGESDNFIFEAQVTSDSVSHVPYDIIYHTTYNSPPFLFANMQTANGTDTAALRVENQNANSVSVHVEEEQSKDDEISHSPESVGYLAVGTKGQGDIDRNMRLFTFQWEYDLGGQDINEFRIYLNGNFLCSTDNPADRILSCTASLLSAEMEFSVTAVQSNGEETAPSTVLRFDPTEFPQLAPTRLATFTWDFDRTYEDIISGFVVSVNNSKVCETEDPTARQLTCEIDTPVNGTRFTVQAVKTDNSTVQFKNSILYEQ
ncbi:PKD domain-containing protein [Desulfomarina sp.]